jgi:hypothetical protein
VPSFDREKPIEILERAEESRPEKGWGGGHPPPPRRSNIRKDRPAECDLRPVSRDPQGFFFLEGGGGCTGKDYSLWYMDTEYRKVANKMFLY